MKKDKRIEEIHSTLIEMASGNFNARLAPSGSLDELDAITIGINMLGEELQASTVSRDYLNRIYMGIVDMLIVLNPNNTIQRINESVCKILLYSEKELVGKPFNMLFPKKELKSLNIINKKLNIDGYYYNIEKTFVSKDGRKIPVSFSCSLLSDSQNNVHGKLYIAKDISKIKKTEEQLIMKNAELNTLVYRASHDLKGPLASTLGLVNLAKQEKDMGSIKHYIDLIEKSTQRLDAILNGLTEITRVTQTSVNNSIINFSQLVQDILDSLRHLPSFKEINFKINIDQRKEFISDNNLLRSVLQNLIENAIKYKKENSRDSYIHIRIVDVLKGIEMEIKDNGLGIPKEAQEHVFKLFYRANVKSSGSGLGLYIVKSSIEKLGGEVSLESEEGKQTTFKIFIPEVG